MLKNIVKKIIAMTPYTISRKSIVGDPDFVSGLLHNSPEHMDDVFGNSQFLKKYVTQHRQVLYEKIISFFPKEFATVADLGCGPGFFLEYISTHFQNKRIFGYDYSPVALEIANVKCPDATLIKHDLSQPMESSFDVIVCSQTLEHVHYPDKVLKNIAAACNKGGRFILTVPDGRTDIYKGHINFWSPESWKIYIESRFASGFSNTFTALPSPTGHAFLIAVVHRD